jgi:hypothetical protein
MMKNSLNPSLIPFGDLVAGVPMRHPMTLGRKEGRIRKREAKACRQCLVVVPLFAKEGVGGVRG